MMMPVIELLVPDDSEPPPAPEVIVESLDVARAVPPLGLSPHPQASTPAIPAETNESLDPCANLTGSTFGAIFGPSRSRKAA